MPDDTTILSLPLILPAQAQKHVTHNEALLKLDLIVQLAVINRTLTTAPALPTIGDRHIVANGATGAWAGQSGRIALYTAAGWQFTQPLPGWQAYVMTESQIATFNGLAWIAVSDGPFTVGQMGVSATPDATNRLSVSSPATLLNHAGSDHQLKVNKAVSGDTASLLFQTGFSGRAEMGTTGSDDFAVKVSADGSAWSDALTAEAGTGEVTLPHPLHLGGQASDPAAPADGTLWLNTTTGEVKLRSAGVTQVVGGGGVADGDKGDITVSGSGATWTIDAGAVSLAKLADIATDSFLGRDTAGSGVPEVLTPAQARGMLNVADGATANASDSSLRDRATHTGTQPASTVTGLAAIATSGSAADLSAGTLPAARFDDSAHGNRAGGTLHSEATTSVAGFMSGADKAKLDAITGTNTGDQTIGLTGDVTGSGTGSFAATIAANAVSNTKLADMAGNTIKANASAATADPADLAVGTNTVVGRVAGNIVAAQLVDAQVAAATLTNAKLANVATATLKGRVTAGSGSPEDLTGSQATALLDTFTSTLKGLAPASGGGTTNFLRADGTWASPGGGGGVSDGDKGDITVSGGGATWTLDAGTVSLSKMADVATGSLLGRSTAGTGVPEALTGPQATALLDTFGSGAKGLAPASGGGTANFLRADGGWAVPEGPGRFYAFHDLTHAGAAGTAWNATTAGTSAVWTNVAPLDGGVGWARADLGTTATGRAAFASISFTTLQFSLGRARFATRVRVAQLSDATNTWTFRAGFIDSVTAESTDGAFFRYTHSVAGGAFQAVTRSNNAETATATGTTVATGTTYVLEVDVNAAGTSVEFRINGAVVATHTTNIPVAVGRETGFGVYCQRSVGTAALQSAVLDYLLVEQYFSGR